MFLDRFSIPEKQSSRRKWGDSFATMSSFPPNLLVPEFAEVGVIGQTRVTIANNYLNCLHIGGRLIKLLKLFQFWQYKSVPTKSNGFWFAVFSQNDAMSTKSDHRQILRKFNVFRWPSQYSTLLKLIVCKKNIPSCLHGDFYRRDLEKFPFLMDVICSPSCTVAAVALRSLSVVCLSRQQNPQVQVFPESEWFLLSSTRKCSMRTVHLHQLLHSNKLGQCVHFQFPNRVVKQLILDLKAIRFTFTVERSLENGIKQFPTGYRLFCDLIYGTRPWNQNFWYFPCCWLVLRGLNENFSGASEARLAVIRVDTFTGGNE